jgi:diguanylate cyclase (GGDEF)-like protein/PAS domain S-box-containing protein
MTALGGRPTTADGTEPEPAAVSSAAPAVPAGVTTSGRAAFTAAWRATLAGTSHVSLTGTEVQALLAELTDRLAIALTAEPFTADAGEDIGRTLAYAGFTEPDSLARTVTLLAEPPPRLLAGLLADHPGTVAGAATGGTPAGSAELAASRCPALAGAVAAGHHAALRERILGAQEALIRAALVARDRAETRFRTVFAGTAVGIGISSLDGAITDANQALRDMLRHPLDELRQRTVADFVHPDDAGEVRSAYAELVRGDRDHYQADKPLYRGDGTVLWTHITMSVIPDDAAGAGCVVTMFEDYTDRHLLETRLRYLATHDPLTQLPNRALLLESLDRIFATATHDVRLGLCFVDLDGFKVVNDCFGHAIGDRLLVEVAGRLDKSVSTTGHLVARMGGDEFVILVADSTGSDEVIAVAERALESLLPPMWIDDHELSVSASIGIVERRVAGTDPAEMLRAADATLYRAKADGKGRWALFDPLRNACDMARYTLSTTMPAALAGGEFFLDYQPVVRLGDGALAGVDAVPRWRHPRLGVLGPDRFADLADETGLTATLSRWLLMTACQQARRWQEAHPELSLFVSVALSPRQCEDPRLVDDVLRIVDQTGLEPGRLQLELNHCLPGNPADEPSAVVGALAARGIRIALSDLPLGQANLAQLRGLPAHTLKLAAGLVQGLRARRIDPSDEQIVAAIVALAHGLNLSVTAAGVETATQAARLRLMDCDAGQGSFLGRPGPPDQISMLLEAAGPGTGQPSLIPPAAFTSTSFRGEFDGSD